MKEPLYVLMLVCVMFLGGVLAGKVMRAPVAQKVGGQAFLRAVGFSNLTLLAEKENIVFAIDTQTTKSPLRLLYLGEVNSSNANWFTPIVEAIEEWRRDTNSASIETAGIDILSSGFRAAVEHSRTNPPAVTNGLSWGTNGLSLITGTTNAAAFSTILWKKAIPEEPRPTYTVDVFAGESLLWRETNCIEVIREHEPHCTLIRYLDANNRIQEFHAWMVPVQVLTNSP